MSTPEFFLTRMGQTFFEGTMPRLYRAVDRLADAFTGKREHKVLPTKEKSWQDVEKMLNEFGEQGFRVVEHVGDRIVMERVVPRKGSIPPRSSPWSGPGT